MHCPLRPIWLHTSTEADSIRSTIAIRFHNGSNVPIATIRGSPQYRETMHFLLNTIYTPTAPVTEQFMHKYLKPYTTHIPRSIFRILGWTSALPDPSLDPTALSSMLSSLIHHAESFLPPPFQITHITLSTPHFLTPLLWRSHILPALHRAHLTPIGDLQPRTNAMEASAAANGIGLCKAYANLPACYDELDKTPFKRIMAIEYTNASLAAMVVARYPDLALPTTHNSFIDTSLAAEGAGTPLMRDGEQKRTAYWHHLRARLHALYASSSNEIEQIIFIGEAAQNTEFLDNVKMALSHFLPPPLSPPFSQFDHDESAPFSWHLKNVDAVRGLRSSSSTVPRADPIFAPALGAAEIAKRAMEAPRACVEMPACVAKRRLLSGEG